MDCWADGSDATAAATDVTDAATDADAASSDAADVSDATFEAQIQTLPNLLCPLGWHLFNVSGNLSVSGLNN